MLPVSHGIITRMPQIEIRSLGHRYGRRGPWVLRDVELTLPEGALVRVTGRNGAGKSTLLGLLAGVTRPARGTITGRPAAIGYAPQRFPAAQPFTVRGYLRRMARMRGMHRTRAKAAVGAVAERLVMTDLLRTPLRELSSGAAKKVGVAQAFLAPAGLLVLDEPFAGLDARARDGLADLITAVGRDGTTVAFSDQEPDLPGAADLLRWQVADGGVRRLEPGEPGDPAAEKPLTTIQLAVPEDDVERLEGFLRARGYDPRRIER